MKNYVLQHDLLTLRANPESDSLDGSRRYRPIRWATGFVVRWEHDAALRELAEALPNLTVAADRLERAWWLLPRADVGAEVCALINLAVVELRRDRPEAARDRLDLVFARTEGGRDPGGRVHAHEIAGIVGWKSGEPSRALRSWQLALTGYRALADDLGTARCLRHLGSALVVAPQHWAAVLGDTPKLYTEQVWHQASGWLAEADRLSPRPSAVGNFYRVQVGAELDDVLPRSTVDRWPLPMEDPELTP